MNCRHCGLPTRSGNLKCDLCSMDEVDALERLPDGSVHHVKKPGFVHIVQDIDGRIVSTVIPFTRIAADLRRLEQELAPNKGIGS